MNLIGSFRIVILSALMIFLCTQIAQPCGWWDSRPPINPPPPPPDSSDNGQDDGDGCGTGNPIFPGTGRETYTVPIMSVPGGPFAINMSAYYDSSHDFCGALGYNWTHNYDYRLTEFPDGSLKIRMQKSQRDITFEYDNGEFYPPAWSNDSLEFCIANPPSESCYNDEDCYIWTREDDTKYFFAKGGETNHQVYLLKRVEDKSGNGLTFTYSNTRKIVNGVSVYSGSPQTVRPLMLHYRLETIQDDVGNTVTLNYIETGYEIQYGRIGSISNTYQGNEVRQTEFIYEITYGNLYRVLRQTNSTQKQGFTFTYDNEHNLTSVLRTWRTGGNYTGIPILENSYDLQGKCYDQTFYSRGTAFQGDQVDYTYLPSRAIVTRPNGSKQIQDLNERKQVIGLRMDMGTPDDPWDDIVREIAYAESEPGCPVCRTRVSEMTAPHYPDETGIRTVYTYNNDGQVVTRTQDPDGVDLTWTYTYDTEGNLTLITPPNWTDFEGTGYSYNSAGLLYQTFRYNTSGTPSLEKTFTYDSAGRILTVTDALSHVTTYEYYTSGNGNGQLKKITFPSNGNVTQPFVEYTYDARGNLYSTTDRSGTTATRTFYQYDWLDRVTQITYPTVNGLTMSETFAYDYYDSNAHLIRTRRTDVNGVVHDTWTDENDRVAKIVRDGVTIEEREYDLMGNLHQVTDARGNITTHWYDGIDRRNSTEYHWIVPDVSSYQNPCETFEYHPDGRILASTDADNNTTVYSYDALNRLVTKQYNDGTTTTYTYVGSGNRIATITENGETVAYTYDNLNRVEVVGSSVHDYEMAYTYNSADQVMTVVAGDGFDEIYNVEYTYYDDGSLSLLEDQINQGVFEFSYLLNGLRQTLERPNLLTTSYSYDNLGRLERITHENSASQILERFDYTYDVDTIDGTGNPVYKGLRTKRMMTSNFISGTTQHYAYNNQGWLTRAKYIDTASGTEAFTYDATGNRTNRTWTPSIGFPVTSTNFTIAPHSDLVTQAGTIGTMDYSVGGNLIDDNWIGREYEWDQFNRVTMVKSATGTPLYGFEYGGTGERTVQNTYTGGLVSSTRAFLYDREDVIAEFSNDTFATVFRRYIHGPGIDEPLAILGDDVGEYTQYLHDGLGSVTGVVDENGKLGAIDYSAFGETRSNTVKIENRYRYTSREFVETNLYYYRARHMRPDLGRFISMDPLKTIAGTNMFGYVGNDPVWWSDPIGMYPDYYWGGNTDPNDPTGGMPVPIGPPGDPSGWGDWRPPDGRFPPACEEPFNPCDYTSYGDCMWHCSIQEGGVTTAIGGVCSVFGACFSAPFPPLAAGFSWGGLACFEATVCIEIHCHQVCGVWNRGGC